MKSAYNGKNCFISNHQFDDCDKKHKLDLIMTFNNVFYIIDVKTSLNYDYSVSFEKDHRFLNDKNLNTNCWFIFLFKNIKSFIMVKSTNNFYNFLIENNCFKKNCIAINYNQIIEFNKNCKNDILWFNLNGTTFGEFFDKYWKRENWSNKSYDEICHEIYLINEICEKEFGPNSDIPI